MSRPNLHEPQSPRLSCWERCTQARRSSPLSPTGCGDGRRASDLNDIRNEIRFRMRTLDCFRPKESLDMNDMLHPNKMVEAPHLPRAGRLTEATALLQRMLRGESGPDMTFGTAGDIVPRKQKPPTIDAMAAMEKTDRWPSSRFGINGRPAGMSFASPAIAAESHSFRRLSALFRPKRPGPM